MAFMALTHLASEGEDPYIRLANETVRTRCRALMDALGLPMDNSPRNAQYYTLVDVEDLAEHRHGAAFVAWLRGKKSDLDFLNDLAEKKGVVLMYGPGFSAPDGTVRISLANLNTEDYVEIARRLFELLNDYYEEYEEETLMKEAA